MLVEVSSDPENRRLAAKASQIINIIITTATREIREPTDETVFQRVYASG